MIDNIPNGSELVAKFRDCVTIDELAKTITDNQDIVDILKLEENKMYYLWSVNAYKYYARRINGK